MNGQVRNIFYLIFAAVTAAMLLALFGGLARNLTPAFRARMEKKASSAPLLRTARKSGLTYEAALGAPAEALGKPVLWCVNISSSQVYLPPGRNKPLDVVNIGEMPVELYGRYSGEYDCRNALFEITGVKIYDFEGARAVRLQASFVDYQ